ncbi:MAG: sugar phosphate isomerase/epimerase, partial [Candidatus Omnitrophica bacterium]|nr:sugar phosphate isomerase/epimerase [Candidatus Omnitrophota bacterium]
SGMAKMEAEELKKLLDERGLFACSTHVSYQEIVTELDRVIATHKILGCEAIMCPGLPGELHNAEGYRKVAKEFSQILPRIREAGLILGYHNHGIELERYEEKTGLEILLENCPGLEAEIDTYWIQYGGGDPATWIEKYAGRVSEVHVKDMGISKNKQVMPPIGTGNLNWSRIIQACREAGVRYCLVEMDTPTVDPFQAIKISLDHLKSWGLVEK